jgi:hypothetical protein
MKKLRIFHLIVFFSAVVGFGMLSIYFFLYSNIYKCAVFGFGILRSNDLKINIEKNVLFLALECLKVAKILKMFLKVLLLALECLKVDV